MENTKEFRPYSKNENYMVSKDGEVYSLLSEKIIKHRIDSGGYHMVGMTIDGKQKNIWVHRMVAETFIPNPNNFKYINHKDEDKSNNNVDNLEWCSNAYNNQTIRKKKPETVSDDDVRYIRENKLRPCEALRYLHDKGYTVRNKCARMIVNGTYHKKITG